MPKIDKILIAVPNTRWFERRYFHLTAYTPCLLAAIVKDYAKVEILDTNLLNLNFEEFREKLIEAKADLLAITCLSMEYAKSAHKLAEIAKEINKDIICLIGGIYPTLMPDIVMKQDAIDYAILGEAEERFPKFIKIKNENKKIDKSFDGIAYRENGEIVINPIINYVQDLDKVPFPDYSIVDYDKYFNIVNKGSVTNLPKNFPFVDTISSRGCPFHCIYCSSQAINGPKIRYRSAENVLAEVDILVNEFAIKHITFNDDNFFLDKKRAKRIMRGLEERNYDLSWKTVNAAVYALDDEMICLIKSSGGYQIFLAIESGNQYVLSKIIKKPLKLDIIPSIVEKCKNVGLQTLGIFMIGLPGETWEQIRETFVFAEKIDLDAVYFNIATPLPCTEMYDVAKEKGFLEKNIDLEDIDFFGFGRATMTTEEFTPFELQVLRAFEWDRINFKSEAKRIKICQMLGINIEELENLRRKTRRNLGIVKIFGSSLFSVENAANIN